MVGLFGIGNKAASPSRPRSSPSPTPPPPYRENAHDQPVFATETTTTTTTHVVTTTTQTTTHFFSLPLWRRRGASSAAFGTNPAPQASSSLQSDDFGAIDPRANKAPMMMDKDLPPTPPLASNDSSNVQDVGGPSVEAGTGLPLHSASFLSSEPSMSGDSSHSTLVLAQAALGISLTHTMPNTISARSSSSDLNTSNSIPPPTPPVVPPATSFNSRMRRAKSFQKDRGTGPESSTSIASVLERRRNRGLSLGPFHFSPDSKGKQREEPDEVIPSTPKLLSRKNSFWSRKRMDSHLSPPALPHTSENLPRPTLPLLQPVSPFCMDTQMRPSFPKSAVEPSQLPAELQRRHSERFGPHLDRLASQPTDEVSASSSKPRARHRRPTRPQTADSASSPRFSSFFTDMPSVVSTSPPQSPSSPPSVDRYLEPLPPPVASSVTPIQRSRSGTTPPLLHRLSVNLFGSPSTSSPSGSPGNILDLSTASPSSSFSSSRPSLSKGPEVSKPEIPRPLSDVETPEVYLQRLTEAVSKSEIATVLASK